MSSFNRRMSASTALGSVNGGGGDVGSPGGSLTASSATEGNVQVVLRIRPPNDHDVSSIPARFQRIAITSASTTAVSVDSGSTIGAAAKKPQVFSYDRVLGPQEGQKELYEAAAERLVGKFMEGFNVTILAYGQTSSGKSYSMGTALDSSNTSGSTFDITPSTGLVPRAVSEIFRRCAELERLAGGKGNLRFETTNSFVELYNEDLLDLLSSTDPSIPASERPTLSIREDKEGHIIWSGLKELKVTSKEDVMANLRSGTALRRTNETDMNAQSSRSHAIFSITLTQRRRVGGPAPPASASSSSFPSIASAPPSSFIANTAPTNSSAAPSTPTRGIPRPSSIIGPGARTMSPTPGSRPTTPSGLPSMLRGGLPRPSSVLGANGRSTPVTRGEEPLDPFTVGKKDAGEWVTITSKFHFVDLAGSERLKRTSALGERLKEGISINSGLLALGNVISALGDPVKARQSTHIPYRDSKLTRLLQDSLGGNAHTLMVACVSPAEFNLTETLSTIKYANRARNIKNRAEVNETEVGWDDVEHLQTTLTKLRKEHASLKAAAASAGVVASNGASSMDLGAIEEHPSASSSAPSSRVLGQLSELQDDHDTLSARYQDTMVEVARLTRQLEEARLSGGEGGDASKGFAEMVAPVIAEYERAIATLESELRSSRASLAHTNNLYREQENQLNEALSSKIQADIYIEELKARVSKAAERESSTESYIRDLEVKLKAYTDLDDSNAGEVAELRKEIARLKESDGNSARYVADLEARLAKTDASQGALSAHVERLEKEVERREEMYRDLEARLQLVDTTKDNKLLLQELDEKDGKVATLERKLEEAIRDMDTIGKERAALQEQVKKSDGEREGLKNRLDEVTTQASAAKRASVNAISPQKRALLHPTNSYSSQVSSAESNDPFFTPATEIGGMDFDRSNSTTPDGPSTPTPLATTFPPSSLEPPSTTSEAVVNKMDAELRDLQEAHSRTLENLDDVSSKYKDALKEIADLAAQVQEARLLQSEASDVVPKPPASPARSDSAGSAADLLNASTTLNDSTPLSPTAIKLGSIPRRRIPTKREPIPTQPANGSSPPGSHNSNGSSQRDFGPRGGGLPRPMSLSQELSSSPSSRSSWGGPAISLLNTSPTTRTATSIKPERSVQSLENEIMSLQATLKLREEEIDQLEKNVSLHVLPPRGSSLSLRSDARSHARRVSDAKSDAGKSANGSVAFPPQENEVHLVPAIPGTPPTQVRALPMADSPLARSVSIVSDQSSPTQDRSTPREEEEDHHRRLEELMRSMAQKESTHKETVDSMNAEIEKVRREHSDIVTLSRDQALNVSTELDGLRTKLLTAQDQHDDLLSKLEEMKHREEDLIASKTRLEEDHAQEVTKLRAEHEEVLSRRDAEVAAVLARRDESHADDLKRVELEKSGVFSESQEEHVAAIASLSEQHSDRLSKQASGHASDLTAVKDEHARALASKESESSVLVERLRSNHAAAFSRLGEEKTTESERLKAALAKSRDEHVFVLQQVRTEGEAKLLETEEKHRSSLAAALAERDAAVAKHAAEIAASAAALEAAHESTKGLRLDHEETVSRAVKDHEAAVATLKSNHGEALAKETELFQSISAAQNAALAAETEQRTLAESKLAEIADQNAQLQSELISLRTSHEVEINKLKNDLVEASSTISQLQSSATETQSQRGSLQSELESVRQQLVQVQSEHKEVTTTRDSVLLDLDSHRTSLNQVQTELHQTKLEVQTLQNERTMQDAAMAQLQAKLDEYAANVPEHSERVTTPSSGPRESIRDLSSSRSSTHPPQAPPPTAPVPPLPTSLPGIPDDSTTSGTSRNSHNGGRTSSFSSGRRSPRSTSTSIDGGSVSTPVVDPRLLAQLEEQNGAINNLNRRLQHCEADLQANIDLVNTLEAALNDSERALRKSRLSANDIAKDRDRLSAECDTLRSLLQHARAEALSLRSSQNDERGKMESQMAQERRQKDTAKKELESRLEEMEKRKSKFNCF